MQLTTCPECGLPAELLDRFALYSTDGPIEHVKIACVNKHWFVIAAERVSRPAPRGLGPSPLRERMEGEPAASPYG